MHFFSNRKFFRLWPNINIVRHNIFHPKKNNLNICSVCFLLGWKMNLRIFKSTNECHSNQFTAVLRWIRKSRKKFMIQISRFSPRWWSIICPMQNWNVAWIHRNLWDGSKKTNRAKTSYKWLKTTIPNASLCTNSSKLITIQTTEILAINPSYWVMRCNCIFVDINSVFGICFTKWKCTHMDKSSVSNVIKFFECFIVLKFINGKVVRITICVSGILRMQMGKTETHSTN